MTKFRRLLIEVEPVAKKLVADFKSQGLAVEVGGSFRRRAEMVGDLDIVVQAESLSDILLPEALCFERLGQQASHGILDLNGQPLGVDIWCATPRQWGAFLWFITGSKELNIKMRSMAKTKGLKLSQFGLFDGRVQVDDGSERGVADALGMDWIEPADRQKFVRVQVEPDAIFEIVSSSGDGFYTVQRSGNAWNCSCPHNQFRKVECKHIKKVRTVNTLAA